MMADRVSLWPVALGKRFIDDGNEVSALIFCVVPYSAVEQRNFERSEVLGTDQGEDCLLLLLWLPAKDFERGVYSPLAERQRGRNSTDVTATERTPGMAATRSRSWSM